jgi:hypothetical protein
MPAWTGPASQHFATASQWHSDYKDWRKDPGGQWHFIGGRPDASSTAAKRTWECKGCNSTNHSKSACSVCGMRRSYAEVVKDDSKQVLALSVGAQTQATIRAQLAEVAARLKAASAAQDPAVKHAQYSEVPVPFTPPPEEAPPLLSRAHILAAIKRLETALSAMEGDDFKEMRASLLEQIDERKKQLIDTKPIGVRVDGARAVLERSRKRLAHAAESVALANQVHEAAKAEESRLTSELAALELQLALGGGGPQAPSTSTSPTTSLEELGVQLTAAVEQLRGLEAVPGVAAEDAHNQSIALLAKFKATLEAASKHADFKLHRLRAKTTPPPHVVQTPSVRIVGKQKVLITDFFGSSKKPRIAPVGSTEQAEQTPCA